MNAATSAAAERTLGQWAELAEQAVRVLNHRTRPAGELADPTDVAEVIGAQASLTGMLPQLLDQLARWLGDQHHGGRLRVDSFAALPDACQAMHATVAALAHAGECLRRAGHAIDTAHQHAAHLAVHDDDADDGRCER
jgi:hypothetical protein